MQPILTMSVPRLSYRTGRKHCVTWGSKSPQIFDCPHNSELGRPRR